MVVEIRIYKRYDADLYSLAESGYSVVQLLSDAVTSYAHGEPFMVYAPDAPLFDVNNKKTIHTRFSIPESDTATCRLLRSIKTTYRNTFCKMVLRNAFLQQNIAGFFSDPSLVSLQSSDLAARPAGAYKNLHPLTEYAAHARQERFDLSNDNPLSGTSFDRHTVEKTTRRVRREEPLSDTAPLQNASVNAVPAATPVPPDSSPAHAPEAVQTSAGGSDSNVTLADDDDLLDSFDAL
jgi:hypothetical protein